MRAAFGVTRVLRVKELVGREQCVVTGECVGEKGVQLSNFI